MMWTSRWRSRCSAITLICFALSAATAPAYGALISTSEVIETADRATALSRVEKILYRADIQRQLVALGVAPEAALRRAQGLSSEELQLMVHHLEDLPAGGDALAVIGAVFLVLLILEVVGVTDIFNRV